MVQEQMSSISRLIVSCEEVMSQLGEYRGQLGDWKTHHLQLQDRLYALVEQNKSAMKLLELEDTSVEDMTTQGEEGKTQLQAMLGNLDTVNTPQEVGTTIDTADEYKMKVEDWVRKCQELFSDVKTVHTSVKVQETIREALEMMTTETGATDNKPEECSVCYNDYDDNQLRPRTLPCGHTFCSQCIDNAIENGQLTCPNCRAQHAATAATQFPISYAVEAFVRKLKDIQLTQKKTVPVKKKSYHKILS
nr:E3 ubiquitin-protein ligase BRE1-like [Procambarus clarkii]